MRRILEWVLIVAVLGGLGWWAYTHTENTSGVLYWEMRCYNDGSAGHEFTWTGNGDSIATVTDSLAQTVTAEVWWRGKVIFRDTRPEKCEASVAPS